MGNCWASKTKNWTLSRLKAGSKLTFVPEYTSWRSAWSSSQTTSSSSLTGRTCRRTWRRHHGTACDHASSARGSDRGRTRRGEGSAPGEVDPTADLRKEKLRRFGRRVQNETDRFNEGREGGWNLEERRNQRNRRRRRGNLLEVWTSDTPTRRFPNGAPPLAPASDRPARCDMFLPVSSKTGCDWPPIEPTPWDTHTPHTHRTREAVGLSNLYHWNNIEVEHTHTRTLNY